MRRTSLKQVASSRLFLLDRTSENLARTFPGACFVGDFGLPDYADDSIIFQTAVDYGLTLVTENDRHFFRLMRRASAQTGRANCSGDGFGIVVPNHRTDIYFDDLTRRLHFRTLFITWGDVRTFNLRVSVGERHPDVAPLPRCKFCIGNTSTPRARQLGLYE